jgi:hypothetical protein
MPTPGLDEYRCHRLHGVAFAIEFHETFALKHEIDLRESLVVMDFRVLADVDKVERRHRVVRRDECPARIAARAGYGPNFIDLRNHETLACIQIRFVSCVGGHASN